VEEEEAVASQVNQIVRQAFRYLRWGMCFPRRVNIGRGGRLCRCQRRCAALVDPLDENALSASCPNALNIAFYVRVFAKRVVGKGGCICYLMYT